MRQIIVKILNRLLFKKKNVKERKERIEDYIHHLRNLGYQIGDNVAIINSILDTNFPFLITIGSNVIITHATILAHDASPELFVDKARIGRVEIKDNCFIGANAVVLPEVTMGPNAIVGAGAIVTKDEPPNTVVAGNPARVICSVQDFLKKKEKLGELIPWKGGILASETDIEYARKEALKWLINKLKNS